MKHLFAKGVAGGAILFFTELQTQFGTVLWVVLGMVILDVLLNVGHEEKQFAKLGSAFVALGAPMMLVNSVNNPAFVHTILALIALAYIQVLYPQLVVLIGRLNQPKEVKQTELDILKQQVDQLTMKLEQENKIVPASTINQ